MLKQKRNIIVGIDTSCDDTSIAIFDADAGCVLSNVVHSQFDLHRPHGGVVPEVASRSHAENIRFVLSQALEQAQCGLKDLSAIAVTKEPGLMGSLLVGTSFAKALAWRLKIPLHGVNHIEAHLFSPYIHKEGVYPFIGLVASGGHTAFYYVESPLAEPQIIGHTVDDAIGEAFDKVGKILGLEFPGGPAIDRRAEKGDAKRFSFTRPRVKMGQEYLSFSGLKTAGNLLFQSLSSPTEQDIDDFCASFRFAMVDAILEKTRYFLAHYPAQAVTLSGGVALNKLLRESLFELCKSESKECFLTEKSFCSDNGAMVAHYAWLRQIPAEGLELETRATKDLRGAL